MFPVLLVTCVIIIILLAIGLHEKSTNAICMSRRRLEGRTVLVTGGTAGMGLDIATDLAHRGARVIIACPFPQEGLNAEKQIIKETRNQNVVFKLLDLASTKSILSFAADILKTENRLDILINNAGVGTPVNFITQDGMSFITQVNYYGTFLLSLLLLPLLKKTGVPGEPSRILCTASILHFVGSTDIDSLNRINHWTNIKAYGTSKMCLVLFVKELSRRLEGSNVVINCVDPGIVGTRIYQSWNVIIGYIIMVLLLVLCKTPWEGAQTGLHAALDEKAGEVSGEYFRNCHIAKTSKRADMTTAKKLWDHSVTILKLSDDEIFECFRSL